MNTDKIESVSVSVSVRVSKKIDAKLETLNSKPETFFRAF
jgi:hypothetical protein